MLFWITNNKGCLSRPLAVTTKPPPTIFPFTCFYSGFACWLDYMECWRQGACLHFFRKSGCPLPDPDQRVFLLTLSSSALWGWWMGRMCNPPCCDQAEVLFPKAEGKGKVWIFSGVVLDFRLLKTQTPTHNHQYSLFPRHFCRICGVMFRCGRRSWGVGGASWFASRSFSHLSYVVCVSRPGRNRLCNGSGAEQGRTGINWLRRSYPVEESRGETRATPFLP